MSWFRGQRSYWYEGQVRRDVEQVVDKWADEYAKKIEGTARRILTQKAKKPTGHLAREIVVVKSKFKNGGYIVQAQGPTRWSPPYHASFVELGTSKMEPMPYLRPAVKKHERMSVNDLRALLGM